ncbi:hypothetical protein LINGRAHAP2_LOCUS16722, partial [Linum grandiflorum]
MSTMKKQALILACILVLATIAISADAARVTRKVPTGPAATFPSSPQQDLKDAVLHPDAGCRCCYYQKNSSGLYVCAKVC